jgi:hypothetical protein
MAKHAERRETYVNGMFISSWRCLGSSVQGLTTGHRLGTATADNRRFGVRVPPGAPG